MKIFLYNGIEKNILMLIRKFNVSTFNSQYVVLWNTTTAVLDILLYYISRVHIRKIIV